jgi:hypothetical protein
MSLLSSDCSPAFFDMAKFLRVDSTNTFVIGQHCATVLPHISLVKVKVKEADKHRKTVDEICCTSVDTAICSHNKVFISLVYNELYSFYIIYMYTSILIHEISNEKVQS